MLLFYAVIGRNHLMLALGKRMQGILYGIGNGRIIHTHVGHRRVGIGQHRQQTHIGPVAQRGIDRTREPVLGVLHTQLGTLQLQGFLYLLTNEDHGIIHETQTALAVILPGSLHQPHIPFTHKVVH